MCVPPAELPELPGLEMHFGMVTSFRFLPPSLTSPRAISSSAQSDSAGDIELWSPNRALRDALPYVVGLRRIFWDSLGAAMLKRCVATLDSPEPSLARDEEGLLGMVGSWGHEVGVELGRCDRRESVRKIY